jgi:ferrous iron transport protein A
MPPNRSPSQTLPMSAPGQRVRVVAITAGQRVAHRLAELGITQGVELCVLNDNGSSPLLVAVRDTRLALERGIAHTIRVQPEEEGWG